MTRPSGGTAAAWLAFALAHGWLGYLGLVVVPSAAFHDVDLYRYWAYLALESGQWPVFEATWVYPVAALVPILLPALVTTTSTFGYALTWCLLVTAIDAAAFTVLLRRARVGAWWWLAFLVLLGPVAIGRLDAVIAPLLLLALLAGARRPRLAAALLTFGAWIKVAPGAVLLPLFTAARRPLREVAVPALAGCAVVVGLVVAAGGGGNLWSFVTTQQSRGLQVESVTATPWVLAGLWRDDISIALNSELVTWEVHGAGTMTAALILDVALAIAVGAIATLLWVGRQRGLGADLLIPGALVVLLTLIVVNKVGSPQFLAWLAPLAILAGRPRWRAAAITALLLAGLTQAVFPWGYQHLLVGDPVVSIVLVARNVGLVVLTYQAVRYLLVALRAPTADPAPEPGSRPGSRAP